MFEYVWQEVSGWQSRRLIVIIRLC